MCHASILFGVLCIPSLYNESPLCGGTSTAQHDNLLKLKYMNTMLLNYTYIYIFGLFFFRFFALNKCRYKTLSFGAIANYCRSFGPLQRRINFKASSQLEEKMSYF